MRLTSFHAIEDLARVTETTELELRKSVTAPEHRRHLERHWNAAQAARILGVTPVAFSRHSKSEGFPKGKRLGNGRMAYSFADLQAMREWLDLSPRRKASQSCLRLVFASVKGGVGKSTVSVHIAVHLALHGYRVLFLDLDPQATATTILYPGAQLDLRVEQTAYPALVDDPSALRDVVTDTVWSPLLRLIPAQLGLNQAEIAMPSLVEQTEPYFWERLDTALQGVEGDYDIVCVDTPPSVSYLMLNAAWAADILTVPVQASWPDVVAIKTFFNNLHQSLRDIAKLQGTDKQFWALRVLINNFRRDPLNRTTESQIAGILRQMFGPYLFESALPHAGVFRTAASTMTTIHEFPQDKSTRRAHDALWDLGEDFIALIRSVWQTQEQTTAKNHSAEAL